jgi:hypothetical protein
MFEFTPNAKSSPIWYSNNISRWNTADNRETTMQSMRRFFCGWMDLKAGHTIQILCVGADRRVRPQKALRSLACFQKSKSLCRGGLPRPPAVTDWLWICDEYKTYPVVHDTHKTAFTDVNVWFLLGDWPDSASCHHMRIPPQMQNPAQSGNLITSAVETPLITAKRRCQACVVFFVPGWIMAFTTNRYSLGEIG